jgi:hypothetical protein
MDAFAIVGSTYESAPLLLTLERRKAGEGAAAADSAQQHCQPSSSAWRLTSRWCNLGLTRALRTWWKFVLAERAHEAQRALEAQDLLLPGRGSALLEAAGKQRNNAADDATSLLLWLRSVEMELDGGYV